ncbi:MAG: hypothetical protein ACRC4W_07715 [Treponemataceae bacterium]
MKSELFFIAVNLTFHSIIVFLALLLRPQTREFSWLCMIAGFVLSFANTIFEVLIQLKILTDILIFDDIPIISLSFSIVISTLFIAAFASKLLNNYS